jgi:hypothetical protein
MPKIDKLKPKVKKKLRLKKVSKKQILTVPTVKHSPKANATDYYNCLLTYANQN